jgi:hypothetical protein
MRAFAVFLAAVIALGAASAFARTWTESSGKQTQGKFVRYHEGDVVILRGSKVVTIPFETLSDEDQEYVRKELAKKGQADQLPSPSSKGSGVGRGSADGRFPSPGPERTWTSNDGKQIRASLVGASGDKVTLLVKGQERTIPISRLSDDDQEYVKQEQGKQRNNASPTQPQPGWAPPAQNPMQTPRTGPSPMPSMGPRFGPSMGPRFGPSMGPGFAPPNFGPPPTPPVTPNLTPPDIPQYTPPVTPAFTPPVTPAFTPPVMPDIRPPVYSPPVQQPSYQQTQGQPGQRLKLDPAKAFGFFVVAVIIQLVAATLIGGFFLLATVWLFNKMGGRELIPQPDFGKAAGISFAVTAISCGCQLVNLLLGLFADLGPGVGLILLAVEFVVMLAVSVEILTNSLPTSIGYALLIMLMESVVGLIIGCGIFMVLSIGGGLAAMRMGLH